MALSPDGKHLVYTADLQLYLRAMDQLEATPIRGTEGAQGPFFSPNGQEIGFWAGAQMKKVSISGGAPVTLGAATNAYGSSWGQNDTIGFGQGVQGIWKVPASGGKPEVLIPVDSEKDEIAHGPQILPDGQAVLFTLGTAGMAWDESQIVVQSLETGERKVLINGGRDARYAPTGHLVYTREETLLAVPFDLAKLEVTGGPVPIVEGVQQAEASGAAQFSFSNSGSLVYLPSGQEVLSTTLVWVNRQGQMTPLAENQRSYQHPRLSPDGKRIAGGIRSGTDLDIWIYDIDRDTHTRLTFEGVNGRPVWTLDGKRVAFDSSRSGTVDLYWKLADGSGEAELLLKGEGGLQRLVTWTPDGQILAFAGQDANRGYDILILPLEGDRTPAPFLATSFDERAPAFSPDGHWLAYISNESGKNEVYVQPYPGPGGKRLISTNGGTEPVWSADGRELFYRQGIQIMAVAVETQPTFTTGTPQVLFAGSEYPADPAGHQGYDVSADGQRFLMVRSQQGIGATSLYVVLNWFEELKRLAPVN